MNNLKILSTKPLPEHSEEFLPFFLGKTEEEAETNYKKFSKLLNNIAAAYARASALEKDDLFGAGLTGLARALRDYNGSRTDNFFMYASYRIRSTLNEYCHKNRAIVAVPSYIAFAHGHINKIKNTLFKYPNTEDAVRTFLGDDKALDGMEISSTDKAACLEALKHLKSLSKNSGVVYNELVSRAEYIPLNVSFEESYMTVEDFETRNAKQIQIVALISTIRDKMTPKEQAIADGILIGKTYDEIGAEQNPPRSAAWVKTQLNNIKKKILKGEN